MVLCYELAKKTLNDNLKKRGLSITSTSIFKGPKLCRAL